MLKRIILWTVLGAAILTAAGLTYFALRPTNSQNDKTGLDAVFAPADSVSRVVYDDKPVRLTYWRTWQEAAMIQPIVDEFQKLHPNVAIEIRDIDLGSYDAELTRAAQTGNLPDIFSVQNDWLPRYVEYTTPAPETVYTEKVYRDTFVDVAQDGLLYNGKIHGVTYAVSTLGLYCNEEIFRQAGLEPPQNWEQFVETSRRLTQKSEATITRSGAALGTSNIQQAADIQAALILQNGAKLTDTPPTRSLLSQPTAGGYAAGAKALEFYASFARPGLKNYAFSDALGSTTEAFAKGDVAMMINYPFKSPELNSLKRSLNPSLDYKIVRLPQIAGEKEVNFAQFWAEAVNKNSLHSEIAWDFVRFAATKDSQRMYNKASYRPTSRKDLISEQKSDEYLGPFAAQLVTAQSFYRGNDKETIGYFYNANVSILSGLDAQLAAKNLERKVTEVVSRYPLK